MTTYVISPNNSSVNFQCSQRSILLYKVTCLCDSESVCTNPPSVTCNRRKTRTNIHQHFTHGKLGLKIIKVDRWMVNEKATISLKDMRDLTEWVIELKALLLCFHEVSMTWIIFWLATDFFSFEAPKIFRIGLCGLNQLGLRDMSVYETCKGYVWISRGPFIA